MPLLDQRPHSRESPVRFFRLAPPRQRPFPLPRKSTCVCAVSHVTVKLRPRLRPPACCESGLSLRQNQVSCEARTVWARPVCVAELALHTGKGAGAGAGSAAAAGVGAGVGAKYLGRRGRAQATA